MYRSILTGLQIALNRIDIIENLHSALETIVTKMATCEFCAQLYADFTETTLNSSFTTQHFQTTLDSALPEFYPAVLVFSVKARRYFDPSVSSMQSFAIWLADVS